MVNMDSWQTILRLKDRVAVIKYELARINRFMQNPFDNKSKTPAERKALWEKAAAKKAALETELKETNKMIKDIVDYNQSKIKKPRGKKKK